MSVASSAIPLPLAHIVMGFRVLFATRYTVGQKMSERRCSPIDNILETRKTSDMAELSCRLPASWSRLPFHLIRLAFPKRLHFSIEQTLGLLHKTT